MSAVVDWLSKV